MTTGVSQSSEAIGLPVVDLVTQDAAPQVWVESAGLDLSVVDDEDAQDEAPPAQVSISFGVDFETVSGGAELGQAPEVQPSARASVAACELSSTVQLELDPVVANWPETLEQ